MESVQTLDARILDEFKNVDALQINKRLNKALGQLNRKMIVLDDDPTGVQTVHDISVYTDWSKESIRDGFAEPQTMFFILTNSRGMTAEASRQLHVEIAGNIAAVSQELGRDYLLISRGDSILRGHYPLETATLKEIIENHSGRRFDGEIICPFFKEGGRFTIGNVHYVQYDGKLVPAGVTEFAKDKTFGYQASHLGAWIEEKSAGEFKADRVIYISLEDLRAVAVERIKAQLMKVKGFNKVVVNAVDEIDVKIFTLALVETILAGRRFMIRSAAAIPKVLGGVSDHPLLTRADLVRETERGGLIIIGSHVKKTTEQLEVLKTCPKVAFIEFNQHLVLNPPELEKEVERVVAACEERIENGRTVAVYTRRERLDLNAADKEEELKVALKISDAVTRVVEKLQIKPAFVVAKGGITSSEIGTKALRVKKARVMGQIKPGVPVWQTDAQSKFPSMAYIIFPGNVGSRATLKEVAELLMG